MASVDDVYDACCITCFPLPTEDDISLLERRLKVRLPVDYLNFIASYNGGIFNEPLIRFPSPLTVKWRDGLVTHEGVGLEVLNGFNATHPIYILGRPGDLSLFDDNDPLQLLVIGYTQVGCLLLLDMVRGHKGEILIKFPDERAYTIAEGIEDLFGLIELPS